jgi:short subunit dehydrogenase-like uncharacterized protein
MTRTRELDLVVFGAPGFTGRLGAEYLQAHHGTHGDVAWALAGSHLAKLNEPGTGPSEQAHDSGRYEVLFIGTTADGRRLDARVKGQLDRSYGSTFRVISE